MTNCLTRFLSAASTIQGKRFVPHPIAVALYTQAVAVEVDFVKLIRAGGPLLCSGYRTQTHIDQIGARPLFEAQKLCSVAFR
jgi:hypothetical protein